MIGVAAANNGKTKEAADLAAELVKLGWGDLVSHILTKMSHVRPDDMAPAFLHVQLQGRHAAKISNNCRDGFGSESGV